MENFKWKLVVGSVSTIVGEMNFRVVQSPTSPSSVEIYVFTPKDLRRSGVTVALNEREYESLKQIISSTDKLISELKSSGQMKQMGIPWMPGNLSYSEIQVGRLGSDYGLLLFTFKVFAGGTGSLWVSASQPYDRRLAGAGVVLGQREYDKMKQLFSHIDSLKPQSGYVLQPRVAASATLGSRWFEAQPQGGCAVFCANPKMTQPLCGW